ncbi:MAG: hypothetical protein WC333_06650 [Dehalococcoidia bacterium]|jgi:hypothetical protein
MEWTKERIAHVRRWQDAGDVEDALDEIARLQSEARWIPVTPETMPENNEIVLLYNRVGGDVFTAQFHQFKRYAVWYIEGEEINVINNKDEYSLWHKIELPFPTQDQP